jgi:putative ABC transport system permease protein
LRKENTRILSIASAPFDVGGRSAFCALGFGADSVVVSFMIEALLIAAAGGALGCLVVLPFNGLTASTLNVQTFSRVATAFKVTPDLLGRGIVFALLMGLAGGLPPAVRAARREVASALRGL